MKRLLIIVLLGWLLLSTAPAAQAHPADMFLHNYLITATGEGLHLTWTITPGPLLISAIWSEVDANQDEVISDAEARAWLTPAVGTLATTINDETVAWQLEQVEWPGSYETFQVGDETIVLRLRAGWPNSLTEAQTITFENQFQSQISLHWFSVEALNDITFDPPDQQGRALSLTVFPAGTAPNSDRLTTWESGVPELPDSMTTIGTGGESATTVLTNLLRESELSLVFLIIALGISMMLGALHALTPGHGKTVVAAYLVGTGGTAWHAIALGAVVTLTHTGSVFAMGLVTLAASRYILPTTIFPLLEIASGVLIAALGLSLLWPRWKDWQAAVREQKRQQTAVAQAQATSSKKIVLNTEIREIGPDHTHTPQERYPTQITWRSLLTLGFSGGLVPCPDAIAILLVAIVINRIALGLGLIVSFSLGLATILIVIGISIVNSRKLLSQLNWFDRLAPAMPVVSALIVLALGIGLTITAVTNTQLSPGIIQAAAPSAFSAHQFDITEAGIIYTALDEERHVQLFRYDIATRQIHHLTNQPLGIQAPALSHDYTQVAYTIPYTDGSSSIALMTLNTGDTQILRTCAPALCTGPIWAPNGRSLIFEQQTLPTLENPMGYASLFWIMLETGDVGPVFQDETWPGHSARWSPDGQWLSYIAPNSSNLEIFNLHTEERLAIPTQSGNTARWSPQSDALLLTDVRADTESNQFITTLYHFDLATRALTDLSTPAATEDSAAAWSPDGQWLAVVRRPVSDFGSDKNGQLWRMRPDGSDARPLTDLTNVFHGAPIWSPDGRYLLYPRYSLSELLAQPGLYLLEVETGDSIQLVAAGNHPAWLP